MRCYSLNEALGKEIQRAENGEGYVAVAQEQLALRKCGLLSWIKAGIPMQIEAFVAWEVGGTNCKAGRVGKEAKARPANLCGMRVN